MACSNIKKVAVFTDTSLDTHMLVSISPEATLAEFKGELESMHSICKPELGKIKVNELKVKRESRLYRLIESFRIEQVFQGVEGDWFLYAEVSRTSEDEGIHGCSSEPTIKGKWKTEKNTEGFHFPSPDMKRVSTVAHVSEKNDAGTEETVHDHRQESDACRLGEPPSDIPSGSVSVSGSPDVCGVLTDMELSVDWLLEEGIKRVSGASKKNMEERLKKQKAKELEIYLEKIELAGDILRELGDTTKEAAGN